MKPALRIPVLLAASLLLMGQYEVPIGSNIRVPKPADPDPDTIGKISATEKYRVLVDFGRCAAVRAPKRTRAWLEMPIGSPQTSEAAKKLASDECLRSGALGISEALFRGTLYNALYNEEYGRGAAPLLSAVATIDYTLDVEAPEGERGRTMVLARRFADCVFRVDPAAVHELLVTEVGTKSEAARFAALTPTLSKCLAKDDQLRFSRPALRGFLAEVAYRLTSSAPEGATAVATREP